MTDHAFTINLSREDAVRSAKRYWTVCIGHGLITAGFILVACSLLYYLAPSLRSLTQWLIVLACALFGLFLLALWSTIQLAIVVTNKVGEDGSNWELDQSGIKIESLAGTSKLEWSEVQKILLFNDMYILVLNRKGHITIPSTSVSEEVLEFIIQQAKQIGAEIINVKDTVPNLWNQFRRQIKAKKKVNVIPRLVFTVLIVLTVILGYLVYNHPRIFPADNIIVVYGRDSCPRTAYLNQQLKQQERDFIYANVDDPLVNLEMWAKLSFDNNADWAIMLPVVDYNNSVRSLDKDIRQDIQQGSGDQTLKYFQ